jgi:hypothetical protein
VAGPAVLFAVVSDHPDKKSGVSDRALRDGRHFSLMQVTPAEGRYCYNYNRGLLWPLSEKPKLKTFAASRNVSGFHGPVSIV